MSLSAQSLAVCRLSLAGLASRPGAPLVIVLSMACVVGVMLSVLSVAAGLARASRAGGDARNTIVLAADALGEGGSSLPRDTCSALLQAPAVARTLDSQPILDCETLLALPPPTGFAFGALVVRGVGEQAWALRPPFKLVAGRLFHPGLHELIVGTGAQNIFGLRVGDRIIMPDGEWPIVGAFSSGGGLLESDLVSDADTLMSSTRSDHFNSVLLRLESPAAFARFSRWITENPALAVTAQRQEEFYLRSAAPFTDFFTSMAFFIATILAIGALFGSLNVLYGRVRARTREITTLRIFGFGALPVAFSVVMESLLLSLLGALIGAACAWLLFNGKQTIMVHTVFALSLSSYAVLIGIIGALAISLLGSLLPAMRAVRLPITEGLRATAMH